MFFQTSVSRTRETTFWVIGPLLGNPFPKILLKSTEGLSIIDVSEFSPGSRLTRLTPGNAVAKRAPEPTFTRAGGQDDVSLNKLPQIKPPLQSWS